VILLSNKKPAVIFVPGSATPAAIVYGKVIPLISDEFQSVLKELEVYAADAPPKDYNVNVEVDGIKRAADAVGATQFHLVGGSAGGVYALEFAAQCPERLLSLALFEPGVYDRANWSPEEQAAYAQVEDPTLAPNQMLPVMMKLLIPSGIPLQTDRPQPPPELMAKVGVGLKAIFNSAREYNINIDQFRQFHQPVYLAFCGLSPSFISWRPAERLAKVFPNIRIEVYEKHHHLNPPLTAEPERFANALRALWNSSS
jgi:pimeloyl-ACP methyl ester carboxylesterase